MTAEAKMYRSLRISVDSLENYAPPVHQPRPHRIGAVIVFWGIVRGEESGVPIEGLNYEAFVPMAERQFGLLFDQVEQRWPIGSVQLAHRIGRVAVGQASLWLEIAAPHRAEAFAAGEWLIAEMKRVVPIWKKAY